ncbi:MAG TPA: YceI family protein [Pseudonocardia sp.]|nr:YceI family protein [Pseudonocardia sp.]
MTTNTAVRPLRPAVAGRWTVDAARSRVVLDARVFGVVAVRGRFTELTGHLDVGADPLESRIAIDVHTGSLTAGNARVDTALAASGLIDPAAGPVIAYRSTGVRRAPGGGWQVAGALRTARGARPIVLRLAGPPAAVDGRMRLHARGRITRDDVAALLSRPGAAGVIGRTAELDLRVELARPRPPSTNGTFVGT